MDEKKAAHMAAAFVLMAESENITKLKLMKLMYLAERESLDKRGFPMTYDNLVCMRAGPVLSNTLDMINYKTLSNVWRDTFKKTDHHYRMRLREDVAFESLTRLSKNDRKIIRKIWRQFGRMTANELSGYTHRLPEYENPGDTSQGLGYCDVLTKLGKPSETAEELTEDIHYYQQLKL